MTPVIFDTDIGIDDAMALLFLHHAANIEIAAIVSGFGNASLDDTTRNALFVRDEFGINAPVFRGAGAPLATRLGSGYPDFVHGANGLGDIDLPEPSSRAESQPGPEAIVDLARRRPGELVIVSVGRMTNLARALQLCPELPTLVREVIVMGGAFGFNGQSGNVSPVAEANIAGDPTAADQVFTSGLPLVLVGLDVTQQTVASDAYFAGLKDEAGKSGTFLYDISRHYLKFYQSVHGELACFMHDASAVAYLLQPDLFATTSGVVRVVTDGMAMGQTILSPGNRRYDSDHWDLSERCQVCTEVDSDAMLALFRQTLVQPPG